MKNSMVFGKHSGRHAVEQRLNELGYKLSKNAVDDLFKRFKQLADKKKVITDQDLEALAGRKILKEPDFFKLDRFTVNCGNHVTSSAVIRLQHNDKLLEEVAIGDGPVDAAYKAIDKMIPAPPHILEDYSINSVTEGNDALGEVIVKIKCGDKNVIGRGLSTDVIEASIMAYINGLNRLL
jgi:2-isopropylmalate synthase